ncbi:MAG: hypothetical protein ACP5VF_09800 [Acidobacteriota bacterium]
MSARASSLFRPRSECRRPARVRKPCPCPKNSDSCRTVVMLAAGMECPFCHLAPLREEAGGMIACPVCGYGTHRPVT